ncbi:hypothetical protein phytr_10580 [Candidatus Phycorickettsia trachydisci]|uniref:Uncharacterized protein n=1 Tax=Candidatus Phycorickettsia trachydisci TaxID=2115978 RepID=A0A2P1P9R0_9RICK|nr:hypothetical protein phytr_10580 [Candidatus Phycorickettsia trachydisci]
MRLGVSENCVMYALKKLKVIYIRPLSGDETKDRRKFCFLPEKALNGGAIKLLKEFY